jgi:hypothetical protein
MMLTTPIFFIGNLGSRLTVTDILAIPLEFVNPLPIISPSELMTITRALLIGLLFSSKLVVTLDISMADIVLSV